jgi:beta-N-acetylhexosaminidase
LPDEPKARRAAIFGCAGTRLSETERSFFGAVRPIGFILFARNCESRDQVRDLVAALRDSIDDADAPVLIDQEGGRVARLKPPHWRAHSPARRFGVLAERDAVAAQAAVRLNYRLIGLMLADLEITVDCAPVLDLLLPETHLVIGDRAFSADPEVVALLGAAAAEGLMSAGVLPVIKHIPGHGRATADSHLELPRVGTPRDTLEATDFMPFKRLAHLPIAMTAHVVYEALDPSAAATVSSTVIADVVRGNIGFDGLLLTDDLSMKALTGGLGERTRNALAAGCDIALHCNGELAEMTAVAEAAGDVSADGRRRLGAALAARPAAPADADVAKLSRRLDAMLQDA